MTLKEWPEEKRKIFSMAVAIMLTIGIVIFWYAMKMKFSDAVVPDTVENNTSYVNDAFKNFNEQFGQLKESIGWADSTSSPQTDSTSTGTSSSPQASTTINSTSTGI